MMLQICCEVLLGLKLSETNAANLWVNLSMLVVHFGLCIANSGLQLWYCHTYFYIPVYVSCRIAILVMLHRHLWQQVVSMV